MATEAGNIFLGVELRESRSTEAQISKIAAKMGKSLAAGLSVKALTAFGKKCIDLGSDLAEVQNVVDVTFTSMNGRINEFARNAAAQFGLSETMAKRYAGTFGAMSKAFGFTEAEAADMSMTLTGLAGDVASFYNITQDEAYTKLKSVFTGETESLKDLGVVMTQTALDQFALQNGFGRTTSAMTEQEKVALRYQFVLDKLSTASGDFARTSGSWANQVRLLKLQFESLCGIIGQGLITVLTPAIKALNSFMGVLVKAANTFKAFVYSLFGQKSTDMAAGNAGVMADALGDLADSSDGAASGLGDVGDSAGDAGKAAKKAAKEVQRSLASFDKITKLQSQSDSGGSGGGGGSGGSGGGGGSGGLGDTASALISEAYDVSDNNGPLDKIKAKLLELKDIFMGGFWEGLGDTSVFESIRNNLERIKTSVADIWTDPAVLSAAERYIDSLAEVWGKRAGAFVSAGATIADNLTGGIANYLEQSSSRIKQQIISLFDIGTEINRISGNFVTALADVFSVFRSNNAKQITADIISIFAEGFNGVIQLKAKWTRDLLDLVCTPFTSNASRIKTAVENTLKPIRTVMDAVADAWRTAWDVLQSVYDKHISPLLKSVKNTVSDVVKNLTDGYNKYIAPVLNKLAEKFKSVLNSNVKPMLENVGKAISAVVDLIKTLWDKVLSPLVTFLSKTLMPVLKPIVELVGSTLITAIGKASDVIGAIGKVIETVATAVKKLVDFISGLIKTIAGLPANVKMTISGATDKAFEKAKEAWAAISNSTVTKTITAAKAKAWEKVKDAWDALKSSTVTKTITAAKAKAWDKIKKTWDSIKNGKATKTINAKITGLTKALKKFFGLKAKGGVYRNGHWSNIQQYAAGGLPNSGQMFIARENGPELVGRLGGGTAVMNNDQIVASVSHGVAAALTGLKVYSADRHTPRLIETGNGIRSDTAQLVAYAKQAESAAINGNNGELITLLREILDILETIRDNPIYLDGKDIRKRIVQLINSATQATGRCEIVI